jgi:hypothetical protein
MTFLRRVAMAISERVVRWASPGCREWAEGLAREVEFIESDWRALAWSLGSMRVLLDRRKAPIRSMAEVPGEAQRLVERIRGGYGSWWVIFQGPQYAVEFFLRGQTDYYRAGCALIVFGSLVAGITLLVDRHRLKAPYKDDVYDDPLACAFFYRAELKRHISRLSMQILSLGCYAIGAMMAHPRDAFFRTVYGYFFMPIILLILIYGRRTLARKIEDIDVLLDERA